MCKMYIVTSHIYIVRTHLSVRGVRVAILLTRVKSFSKLASLRFLGQILFKTLNRSFY